ncbi:Low temperature requirement protein LtrA [Rhodoferax sp. OV413]|uniref:low temperature requirement protein A n=1 Tax=Rhodoferax sp. OV413 TaxID=1855285 RepID=UPI00088A0F76|nr:low temperature requirement protein A [Rhodoferax sp. OV413]SDP82099.1 Low temperature requirement protein LtrA [Rhodoferax sp. OV413]
MHTVFAPRRSLLRNRGQHDSGKVEMVELFFDLVFVFAITQLSHTLLADLGPANALRVGLMLVAVWWVWIFTSWVTNWLDPNRPSVRACLLVLMLAGLVLSASVPQAFGDKGWAFALAYAGMQVGRTLFMLWALRGQPLDSVRNFQRILVWLVSSGALWLIGGGAEGPARLAWWGLALAIELLGPALFFWVPGLGRSRIQDWNVDGNHMAERCALFVIIALGESLLVSGATFAGQPWNSATALPFLVSFVGTVAMWWLYFAVGAEHAHHRIVHAEDPGRQARIAYTYLHVLIVAGVIVCAVADELVLAHPDHADTAGIAAILGGPALYLLGTALFKWVTNTRRLPPLSHLVGLGLLAVLVVPALQHTLSALGLAAGGAAVLWLVAVWESIALKK